MIPDVFASGSHRPSCDSLLKLSEGLSVTIDSLLDREFPAMTEVRPASSGAVLSGGRAAWLAERQGGIGASDAAAALGISPWKTPFALWSEKTGLAPPLEPDDSEPLEWGSRLEPVIIEAYAERTGRAVRRWPQDKLLRSSVETWLFCTPDALQIMPDGRTGLLQVKTAGMHAAEEWHDGPPLHYLVQIQHELMVSCLSAGTLCVLLAGQHLKWFDIEADPQFHEVLLEHLRRFWSGVLTGAPPLMDGSRATATALTRMHPDDDGRVCDLPDESDHWAERLARAKKAIKEAEEEAELASNHLKQALGRHAYGVTPGGVVLSWKTHDVRHEARPASVSKMRVLRKLKSLPKGVRIT